MNWRPLVLMTAAVLAMAGSAAGLRGWWQPQSAVAATQDDSNLVLVEVAAARRKALPVQLSALGTVSPINTITIKPRLETAVTRVHVRSGADVLEGELLFTLDGRHIEAEIRRVEAVIAGAQAQLEQAERDVFRYSELLAKSAATIVAVNNAKTQAAILRAAVDSNKATLETLQIQLDHTRIHAPISGRISSLPAIAGSFVRSSDTAPLATVIQIAPIHVAVTVPQHHLAGVRDAVIARTAMLDVIIPGGEPLSGPIGGVDSTVDATTGMVTLRATFANADARLWPGSLVTTRLTLRSEQAIVVPSAAVQVGQTGNFVFVIRDGRAEMRPVRVARTVDNETAIAGGLQEGEVVVTEGHLLLTDGAQTRLRKPAAGV